MKIQLLSLFLLFISHSVFSQNEANDSVQLGASYKNDVYYNLETGNKFIAPGNNWNIAFSTRNALPPMDAMRSTTILVNESRNNVLFKSNQTNWATFDTTGYKQWAKMNNTDTSWVVGAFNADYIATDPFDYGWGAYSLNTHDVNGKGNIYLIRLSKTAMVNGQPSTVDSAFKKIRIDALIQDTQWVFTIANLDGTDSNQVIIKKKNFAGKLFAYYDMVNNMLIDREPASNWDLLFTRYNTWITQFNQTMYLTTTGVFQHPNALVAQVDSTKENEVTIEDATKFTSTMNTIGTDWKINPGPGMPYFSMVPDLTYYIRLANNQQYRLNFRSFAGSSSGNISFYKKTEMDFVGINNAYLNLPKLAVYPNPTSQVVTINVTQTQPVYITDVTGKQVLVNHLNAQKTIDVSALQKGVYFIHTKGFRPSKLIIE